MRRSPAGTPGIGQSSGNASPTSNPIAAGFAYGATGQRAGSGLNPQNTSQQQQQQHQSGTASPGTGSNRPSQIQSRTGNNATPLTAPSIVSRTSGSAPTASGGLSAASAAELEGIANSAAALASNGRLGGPISPLPNLPSPATASPKALPNQQGQVSAQQQAQNRYGAYGNQSSLSAVNAQAIRDPRTPNPVTESLLSRSPVSAGATSATNAASANRPPSNPTEQSRTGGIATPLAPPASAAAGSANVTRPGAAGAAATPPGSSNKDSPAQKAQGQTGPPASAGLSWRSLLDRPYSNPYGPAGGNQANRTQSPNQRSGHWFNPLAVKQQSSAQASQQAQAHAQAQAMAQAAGQRPPSAATTPAGSPKTSTLSPASGPTSAGATGSGAQQQANKRRTASTSAATPPYNMSSMYGNRPDSASADAKDGSQPQRAVTASPVVGASTIPTPASTAGGAQAGSTSNKSASPAHQHRPNYSMTYGERLQQIQAQSVRERERERESREWEMRERERTAAAIAAGPKTAQGSPPLSIARSPYYGLTGGTSAVPLSAGKAASPPTSATGAMQSPLSPPRKPADRPSSTSAFGYLFGGGGASRVATEGGANQTGKASPQSGHALGVTSGGASGQNPAPGGHYRSASSGAGGQVGAQQQQQQQNAAYNRQPIPTSATPVSRTQNTGLGLSAGMAQANWRAQGHHASPAGPGQAQQAVDRKPEVSPQLAAQQAVVPKAIDGAGGVVSPKYNALGPHTVVNALSLLQNGQKRKLSDEQEYASQIAKQSHSTPQPQPPPATLHALRHREGPLFTAEDIKGAALRPPLMIVRSDNVVKALHKLSAQHLAAFPTSPATAPFIGRVIYDPFLDPAQLLDGDLLRKGVGGKVEIWLDTEWLKGEVWEAGAPSHPAVSHPPSPSSDDMNPDRDGKMNGVVHSDGMQVDESVSLSPVSETPLQTTAVQRREDLPPSWTLWDLVPLKERKIWGTDVYTDDSDILAACIHSGWLRLGSTAPLFGATSAADNEATQRRKRRKRKPTLDHRSLKITIVIAPKLIKYEGSLRAGVWSRSWGNSHDGVSYAIESVELVEVSRLCYHSQYDAHHDSSIIQKARHRLTPTRWKAYDQSFTTLAKQRCSCTMACEHSDRPTLYPRSLKLGEMLIKASR